MLDWEHRQTEDEGMLYLLLERWPQILPSSGLPTSGLPTSGLPTGRQSWGRQFWIYHSSGLPILILYWFFSFSLMKQCFEGSKASTKSISQVLQQSNSCIGTIRQSQGGSFVKSLNLSQQIVGWVFHGPEYQLMIFDTIQRILKISDLSMSFFCK